MSGLEILLEMLIYGNTFEVTQRSAKPSVSNNDESNLFTKKEAFPWNS